MKNIYVLIGTRPNFIKVTQFKVWGEQFGFKIKFIHTGQHYDQNMSNVFFDQFDLRPDYFLEVGGQSPNSQVANIILKLEELFKSEGKPDLLVVPGDVNSTLAGAIAANKMGVKLAHLESGLRSFDKTMPEEHNRVVTDHLSDICFVTEPSGIENLSKEKVQSKIYHVGNTMIDTMVAFENQIDNVDILNQLGLLEGAFVLMTIHRPATVDSDDGLEKLHELIQKISEDEKVVFPIHPRTTKNLKEKGLYDQIIANKNLVITDPLGYFEFQKLVKSCHYILTDSGGIQEESTFRRKPCLTLRPNTERPSTTIIGSNTLVPFDLEILIKYIGEINNGTYKKGEVPSLWDGLATKRIMEILST